MRGAIPPEKRVAIALWRMGTPDAYRTIGELFGVGRSTACAVTHEVCLAITEHLHYFITFPEGQKLNEVVEGFENDWNFPQCVGAIDGSHIEIIAPKDNPRDYFNRKGYHSLILQAVVDHKCRYVYHFT